MSTDPACRPNLHLRILISIQALHFSPTQYVASFQRPPGSEKEPNRPDPVFVTPPYQGLRFALPGVHDSPGISNLPHISSPVTCRFPLHVVFGCRKHGWDHLQLAQRYVKKPRLVLRRATTKLAKL
jgi:hypothetical protein